MSLACAVLCAAPSAFALDTGDIVITSLKGEVHVVMSGTERAVRAGAVLELPATVRTGADGAIELRQGATTVGVGPDTLLEFPALEKPGGPIDRIVQPRGNAFYNIGKRPGRRLRIETPYLVGVVKGTQFNVVAQEGATTISLFEGLLEIRSADDSDVIDLHAGEIASRSRADTDINVLKMNGNPAPAAPRAPAAPQSPAPQSPSGAEGKGNSTPAPGHSEPITADDDSEPLFADRDTPTRNSMIGTPAAMVAGEPSVDASVDRGSVINVSVPAVVDLGGDVVAVPELNGPAASPPAVSIPEVTETLASVTPPVDLPVEVLAPAPVVDVVSLPAVDVSVDVGGGALPVEVTAGAAVDPVAQPAVNVDVSAGLGNTNVDLGVSVGGGSLVDVDLGLDDDNSGPGSNSSGNNGNGQGNDGIGPGNNGQGNNDKGVVTDVTDVVDAATELLDKLRGKSGKK